MSLTFTRTSTVSYSVEYNDRPFAVINQIDRTFEVLFEDGVSVWAEEIFESYGLARAYVMYVVKRQEEDLY